MTTILFFALAVSLAVNLWQSIRHDQKDGFIQRLIRENESLNRTIKEALKRGS